MDLILPFKVGGVVELRSFDAGYRGAWFRCKISDMCIRNGHMEYQVEYMDYPEEKRSWSRLYKVPPKYRRKAGRKAGQNRELMLRPPFPPWCRDNDIPEHGQKMDVLAVVSSPWKVGDLIDWRHTSCFWTGKITELLGDDKAMIVCPEIPLGEGGCYEVDLDDLRPALDWSLEKGWSAPLSKENGECWYTARLVTENPDTGSSSSDEDIEQSDDGIKEVQKCWNGSFDTAKQEQHNCLNGSCVTAEKVKDPDVKHPASRNGRHCMKSQPHSEEEPQNAEYPTSPMANSGHSCEFLTSDQSGLTSLKKLKTSTECASVQQPPGTAGDALMDLEKLVLDSLVMLVSWNLWKK
ncbi:uncharacterized protein LOC124694576 [Lolium rigidum]|uniref:uncharacterized protein LOC124694576 n=1 Tax=Lolium rigidum TaxID=89674 RepID=UPI001F5D3C26|nr:uncharacterized protein LOC124694576 [Lolium rigidum]